MLDEEEYFTPNIIIQLKKRVDQLEKEVVELKQSHRKSVNDMMKFFGIAVIAIWCVFLGTKFF